MSELIYKQSEFLLDVCKLIQYVRMIGFEVTAGELYRTREQQEIYLKHGKTKTMDSKHLKRLAVDLNFFKRDKGKLRLTYDKEDLKGIGAYWEGLNADNKWGGNFNGFDDTCHFERKE